MKLNKTVLWALLFATGFEINTAQENSLPTFPSIRERQNSDGASINRYIVKFKDGSPELMTRMQQASDQNDFELLSTFANPNEQPFASGNFLPKDNAEVLYLNSEEEVKIWEENDDVEYVELDTKIYLQSEEIPYGIEKVQALEVPDTDVSNRKVCIIDTGYDNAHPDLTSDPNVVSGYNGSFSAGAWDVDGNGHGTHVAGTIAAIGGNDKGVVGVNRNGELKLFVVKLFDNNGDFAWRSDLVAAVEICVDNGSNIVNMSLGGGGFSQFESDAYDRILNEENVLLVAAAGNDGNTAYSYPASYEHVISVAATDSNDNVASFSQKNDQVDIAAPGVAIRSTLPRNVQQSGYDRLSGTSMATPHVSGVAALIWSLDISKSAVEIREILEASAEDLGSPGRDNSYGRGLLRADRARDLLRGSLPPSPVQNPVSCSDSPMDWHDSDGPSYDCNWYALGTNCQEHGNAFENFGKTAAEACCACGGGSSEMSEQIPTVSPSVLPTDVLPQTEPPSPYPSKSPTISPSVLPMHSSSPAGVPVPCNDNPMDWYDSDGPFYDCNWYADGTNCQKHGDSFENFGKTASEACCACGGGSSGTSEQTESPSPYPSKSPTVSPSMRPTDSRSPTYPPASCIDSPMDWYDSDGASFDCNWYAFDTNCQKHGDDYENFGKTASEACCVCGGGSFGTSEETLTDSTSTLSHVYDHNNLPSTINDGFSSCPTLGEALLRVEVTTDGEGSENKFVIRRRNGGGGFRKRVWIEEGFQDNTTETFEMCLPKDQCYRLFMFDFGLDGMCCEHVQEGLKVIWDGSLVMDTLSNFSFTTSRRTVSPKFGDEC